MTALDLARLAVLVIGLIFWAWAAVQRRPVGVFLALSAVALAFVLPPAVLVVVAALLAVPALLGLPIAVVVRAILGRRRDDTSAGPGDDGTRARPAADARQAQPVGRRVNGPLNVDDREVRW